MTTQKYRPSGASPENWPIRFDTWKPACTPTADQIDRVRAGHAARAAQGHIGRARVLATNDDAQMRHHQLPRRIHVALVAQPRRQIHLLLLAQHGHAIHALDVLVQAAGGGNGEG